MPKRPLATSHGDKLADPRTSAPNTTDRYQAASALAKTLPAPDYGFSVPGSGSGVTAGQDIPGGPVVRGTERRSSGAGVTAGDVLNQGPALVTEQRASASGVKGHAKGSARGVSGASNRMKRVGST